MSAISTILDEIQERINALAELGVPATLLATWHEGTLIKMTAQANKQDPATISDLPEKLQFLSV